jgi:hypothetical protein
MIEPYPAMQIAGEFTRRVLGYLSTEWGYRIRTAAYQSLIELGLQKILQDYYDLGYNNGREAGHRERANNARDAVIKLRLSMGEKWKLSDTTLSQLNRLNPTPPPTP